MYYIVLTFLMIVYLVAGYLLAIPYTYLANGEQEHLMTTSLGAPIIALLLLVFVVIEKRSGNYTISILFFLWILLPILLNGLSILLKETEHVIVAEHVFQFRYKSMAAIPTAVIVSIIIGHAIWDTIKKLCQKMNIA